MFIFVFFNEEFLWSLRIPVKKNCFFKKRIQKYIGGILGNHSQVTFILAFDFFIKMVWTGVASPIPKLAAPTVFGVIKPFHGVI